MDDSPAIPAPTKQELASIPLADKTLRDDAAFAILVAIITNQGLGAGYDVLVQQAYDVADLALAARAA